MLQPKYEGQDSADLFRNGVPQLKANFSNNLGESLPTYKKITNFVAYKTTAEAMYLDTAPRIEIKVFADLFRKTILLKQEKEAKGERLTAADLEGVAVTGGFVLNSLSYAYTLLGKDAEGRYSLLFEWKDSTGESHKERVFLQQSENHIAGLRSYFLFLCPFSGRRCRTLLADSDGHLAARAAFKGVLYKKQCETHQAKKSSTFVQIVAYLNLIELQRADPYRKLGKTHYRGKPTPYGKRLTAYETRCEKAFQRFSCFKSE